MQPTPVFLPGNFLRGAWWATVLGVTESDMTEHTHIHSHLLFSSVLYIMTTRFVCVCVCFSKDRRIKRLFFS